MPRRPALYRGAPQFGLEIGGCGDAEGNAACALHKRLRLAAPVAIIDLTRARLRFELADARIGDLDVGDTCGWS